MEFPEESVRQARWIVGKYRKKTSSKYTLAAMIFDKNFLEIDYGFSEAIRKGNCGLYLHEIDDKCDCFTHLGVNYLVAREAGLNPRIWDGKGMRDVPEGLSLEDVESYDHGFVTVEVGKGKTIMMDTQMGRWGYAKFDEENHVIEIYNRGDRKIIYRHYNALFQLSEEEYLKRLESNRSPEGGRRVLETTQRIEGAGNRQVYLSYSPESSELKSSIRWPMCLLGPENYSKELVTDLVTQVEEDGSYNFNHGELRFYNVSRSGWAEHENPQVPLIIPVADARLVWRVFEETAKEAGRKSPVNRMNYFNLEQLLRRWGFSDDLTVKPDSPASRVIERGLAGDLEKFREVQQRLIEDYLARAKKHTITYKSLLRHAGYIKLSDAAKSEDNPYGLISTENEREEMVRRSFEGYKSISRGIFETNLESARISARLKKGSDYASDRLWQRTFQRARKDSECFDSIRALRRAPYPFIFPITADWEMYRMSHNIDRLSVAKLEEGLTEADIIRGTQQRLFSRLVSALTLREALFLASYKPGLKKILDRRGD